MDISGILSKVKSGGFVNPIGSKVQSSIDSLTIPTLAEFTIMANAQYAALIPPQTYVPEDIAAAHDASISAHAKMGELIGHSNRISGVDLSGTGTLATIAKTMNAAKSINGDNSCSAVLGAFGTIQKAAELVTDTLSTVTAINNILLDIPGQIASIPNQLIDYANKVVNQIATDISYIAQAQIAIVQNSIANSLVGLFDDECSSQILSAVMTQPLKDEVSKVSKIIQNKKLISIG